MFIYAVLARNLKSHPSVAQNLLKIQQERSALQALIGKTIRELREYRFDSLINTVEDEYRKRNTLQNTINRYGLYFFAWFGGGGEEALARIDLINKPEKTKPPNS